MRVAGAIARAKLALLHWANRALLHWANHALFHWAKHALFLHVLQVKKHEQRSCKAATIYKP